MRLTWASVRGIATVALFLLLMRLYDELKDAETDMQLGRAGDPLYRDRPSLPARCASRTSSGCVGS